MASERTWEELVRSLARDLAHSLREELYWVHYDRLKSQKATSEKLVYMHLLRSQPQTFTGILRSLDLSSYTVDQALRRLRQGAMKWTPLIKILVKESTSPWKAQVIIKWLLENEYIERPDRGVYRITEKGRALLKTI